MIKKHENKSHFPPNLVVIVKYHPNHQFGSWIKAARDLDGRNFLRRELNNGGKRATLRTFFYE